MAKPEPVFVCESCGALYQKWQGQCKDCGEWNSIAEQSQSLSFSKIKKSSGKNVIAFENLQARDKHVERWGTSNAEMDRVLGGGLVPGSAILIGGDPGIGKSTLLLQIAAALAGNPAKSGSASQRSRKASSFTTVSPMRQPSVVLG